MRAQCNVLDSKSVVNMREKNREVDSIESSGEVKECQKGDFARVRSKQQLVDHVEEIRFCTMVCTVDRLKRMEKVV